MRSSLIAAALGAAVAIPGAAVAGQAATPTRAVLVSNAWTRPTPLGMRTGVVYLTVVNPGRAADRLVAASTPVAARMELHRSSMAGGVMSMAAVPGGVEIPAGGSLTLQPGGYHFMLVGMTSGLPAGGTFPVTLAFAHAGRRKVMVSVRAAAPAPAMAGMKMP